MRTRWTEAILFLFLITTIARAQKRSADFPFWDQTTTSPDGHFALLNAVCKAGSPEAWNDDAECRDLWLIDNQTKQKRFLLKIERIVDIGWAPQGNLFFLNDNLGSNIAQAYVYFPKENRRLDLQNLIDAKFPHDQRFERESHHYLRAVRWYDAGKLLVERVGHFDEAIPNEHRLFTVCYLVTTKGRVTKLSEDHREGSSCKR